VRAVEAAAGTVARGVGGLARGVGGLARGVGGLARSAGRPAVYRTARAGAVRERR